MKKKKMSEKIKIITLFIICFGLSKTVRTQQCFWLFCLLFPHCHSFHFILVQLSGSTTTTTKRKKKVLKIHTKQTNKQNKIFGYIYFIWLRYKKKNSNRFLCVTNKQTTLHSPVMLRQGTIIDCTTEYRTYGMYTKEYYITRKKNE